MVNGIKFLHLKRKKKWLFREVTMKRVFESHIDRHIDRSIRIKSM